MQKPSELRERAAEFIRRAAESDDIWQRIALLKWASAWTRLANSAEAARSRTPENERVA
jgi:hypothetical protein